MLRSVRSRVFALLALTIGIACAGGPAERTGKRVGGSGGKDRHGASFVVRSGATNGDERGGASSGRGSSEAGAGRDAAGGTSSEAGAGASTASGGSAGSGAASGNGSEAGAGGADIESLPPRAEILEVLTRANDYFVAKWPDPGADIRPGSLPSHVWHRAVYFEGLMALHMASPNPRYLEYATAWGESHAWGLNGGVSTRNADNQCAGQTYIELYLIDAQPVRLRDIRASVDAMLGDDQVLDWSWIDAIQMAMPVFAKLGRLSGDARYYDKMYRLYSYTRNTAGNGGLFSPDDGLWWRDATFAPPYAEPNGEDCYWSRGNGWVIAGLARVLDVLPDDEAHRAEYLEDFLAMAAALSAVQREDGFWNVSLADPTHFNGKELTGTSLFTYAMAWGVRRGILDEATYRPIVIRAFNAMLRDAVHPDGALGYAQSTGNEPSDGQPLSYDRPANFEDFAVGCFLLAGSEVLKLSVE